MFINDSKFTYIKIKQYWQFRLYVVRLRMFWAYLLFDFVVNA